MLPQSDKYKGTWPAESWAGCKTSKIRTRQDNTGRAPGEPGHSMLGGQWRGNTGVPLGEEAGYRSVESFEAYGDVGFGEAEVGNGEG